MTKTTTVYPFDWALNWARAQGLRVWSSDTTSSTNAIAKNDLAPESAPQAAFAPTPVSEPSLYLARRQSEGRGRGGNSWITTDGALLSSWAFALHQIPQPIFAPLAGLALYEAAVKTWPMLDFNLKAPNDLYIGDKKTAGILIETVDQGHEKRAVVGLGLNVATSPTEISTSTCLAEHLVSDQSSMQLNEKDFASFLSAWVTGLKAAMAAGLNEQINQSSCTRLLTALNRHPLLTEPILSVDPLGQIRSASRTLYWHEL